METINYFLEDNTQLVFFGVIIVFILIGFFRKKAFLSSVCLSFMVLFYSFVLYYFLIGFVEKDQNMRLYLSVFIGAFITFYQIIKWVEKEIKDKTGNDEEWFWM